MFKNVASQKLQIFAFDITTGAPKTGDAANLTAYVAKDYGTVTVLGDTSATEMDATNAKGWYLFDLTQAETNADSLLFTGKSSTANISLVGVWMFTVPSAFGLVAGATNGLFIAGTNAATTITTALTTTFTGNLTGSAASVTGAVGSVTGAVGSVTGAVGSVTAKVSVDFTSTTIPLGIVTALGWVDNGTLQSATATGCVIRSAASFGDNILTGHTIWITGGTGIGESAIITSNVGSTDTLVVAPGWITTPDNTSTYAIYPTPPSNAGTPIRTGLAAAGAATTITLDSGASASNSFYNNDLVVLTGGAGAGQSRFITAYVGATKVATVATWVTNPDSTSTFAIIPFDAVAGATAPTVAQIATGVWQDTTAGDFTTAGSIGKSLFTSGAVPGATGGLFIAGTNAATTITTSLTTTFTGNLTGSVGSVTGAVGSVTGLTASNLDTTVSSRMATYTQPTGFLAATFPSGTVANTTNITAGTITTVTNLTNAPTAGDFTATMKTSIGTAVAASAVASVTGNVGGNVVGSVGSVVGAVGSVTSGVTVTTNNDKTGYTLSTAGMNSVSDNLLDRDMSTGTDSGSTTVRTARQALFALRNKVDTTTLTVYKCDDTTASWTFALTTDVAALPITKIDPA